MSLYQFSCEKCKIYWEKEASITKAPKRAKCPKCKKQRERYYDDVPTLHFKGMDFYCNMAKAKKFHQYGASKDDALKYYNESIRATRKRIEDTTIPYSKMAFTHEYAKKMGAKKLSESEKRSKIEKAKQITQQMKNLRKNK